MKVQQLFLTPFLSSAVAICFGRITTTYCLLTARCMSLAAHRQGFLDYTEKELPAESPPQFGLHPNAEIGYLTNSCENLFKAILNIAG